MDTEALIPNSTISREHYLAQALSLFPHFRKPSTFTLSLSFLGSVFPFYSPHACTARIPLRT